MRRFAHNVHYHSCNRRYSDLVHKLSSDLDSNVPAIIDAVPGKCEKVKVLSYRQLYGLSKRLAIHLRQKYDMSTVKSIGSFSINPESDYVITMVATWILGKTFVPLCPRHPIKEIEYFVQDSSCSIIVHNIPAANIDKFSISHLVLPNVNIVPISSYYESIVPEKEFHSKFVGESLSPDDIKASEDALVLYTSGTTGRPKGVLHTHTGLKCMMEGLVSSWKYTSQDSMLHFLPLHHLHGVLNKLLCVLYARGTVRFLESASPVHIWKVLASSKDMNIKPLTMFMAVPTVYAKLIESIQSQPDDVREKALAVLRQMRLHVSGSAALPDVIMHAWEKLTGHMLLERYGMTELGMVLSNSYDKKPRRVGSVGFPLPKVENRIVDENEHEVEDVEIPGELRVRGPTVFKEYLNRPDTTKESFDAAGWFRTGDIAVRDKDGYYRLLGRNSTDIIKRAGYKLSALEIEREILSHPQILEAAVIGVPDAALGENVAAVIMLRQESSISSSNVSEELNKYLDDKLAHYKRPKVYAIVSSIPRNHMGKVNKKTLAKELNLDFTK